MRASSSGLMLGFVLGVISLIWLFSSSISWKQRLRILVGIVLDFLMGFRNIAERQQAKQNEDGTTGDTNGSNTGVPVDPIVTPVGNSR
jgi:hypothetical protein